MPLSPELRALLEAHARQAVEIAQRLVEAGEMELAIEYIKRASLPGDPAPPGLTKSTVTGKLPREMEAAHRQKLSDARMDSVPPMLKVAREHGQGKIRTVADLAEALGYTKSGMSRVLSGDRGISDGAAAKFQELTGKPWRAKKG